jgi:hypothetical protein
MKELPSKMLSRQLQPRRECPQFNRSALRPLARRTAIRRRQRQLALHRAPFLHPLNMIHDDDALEPELLGTQNVQWPQGSLTSSARRSRQKQSRQRLYEPPLKHSALVCERPAAAMSNRQPFLLTEGRIMPFPSRTVCVCPEPDIKELLVPASEAY